MNNNYEVIAPYDLWNLYGLFVLYVL